MKENNDEEFFEIVLIVVGTIVICNLLSVLLLSLIKFYV